MTESDRSGAGQPAPSRTADRSGAGQPAPSRTTPIPPGTRDVLPDEMRELRAICDRMGGRFEGAGYGEIHTPALEYEEVLRRGEEHAAGARYRTFDERGDVLALRSDMTIPIARVVATRYGGVEPPLRFSYFARAWRAVDRGVGEPREFLQGGIELIGVPAPEAEAEVVALTVAALEDAGLRRHRLGLGDGVALRRPAAVPGGARGAPPPAAGGALAPGPGGAGDGGRGPRPRAARAPAPHDGCPQLRGGPEVLERADALPAGTLDGLKALYDLLERRGVAGRVIFDLGLVRELGYYTGAVFEVYDPAVGFTLGGGGRYDELLSRFGRDLPACGLALDVQRVHLAQAAEEALA